VEFGQRILIKYPPTLGFIRYVFGSKHKQGRVCDDTTTQTFSFWLQINSFVANAVFSELWLRRGWKRTCAMSHSVELVPPPTAEGAREVEEGRPEDSDGAQSACVTLWILLLLTYSQQGRMM
jgi:hypothetical protein